jgi:lipopolysaccharide transport system permease protein
MQAAYERPEFHISGDTRVIDVSFRLVNHSHQVWRSADGYYIGWQVFDPESSMFISEGEWQPIDDLAPAQMRDTRLRVTLPPERGRYHVYVSPLHTKDGWLYARGGSFVLIDATVEQSKAYLCEAGVTSLRALRWRTLRRSAMAYLTQPALAIWRNRSLIRSMVRRDVLARYRGSFGDAAWTVLNPLLLMLTYLFVFGIVLQSRFGADNSRTGFVLYFLAGMLPWIAFSEAAGRAPTVIVDHRNFVKKLVFPVETLPVNQVAAGLVTQAFATAVFLVVLLVIRGGIPATSLWLPALLVPQVLLTLGCAWFLSALGVYVRDLGQIIGFVLTLCFFLTPICYPESSLPREAAIILTKSPLYVLVRGYRDIFLEGHTPMTGPVAKLWLVSIVAFLAGYAWFHKLRKSFADVI